MKVYLCFASEINNFKIEIASHKMCWRYKIKLSNNYIDEGELQCFPPMTSDIARYGTNFEVDDGGTLSTDTFMYYRKVLPVSLNVAWIGICTPRIY